MPTNTINMTKEEWTEYIKAHPKAKSLRLAPLPYPDLCRALFDGATATGVHSWGPSSQDQNPGVTSFSSSNVWNVEQSDREDIYFCDEDGNFRDTRGTKTNDFSHRSQGEKPKKKKKISQPLPSDTNLINEMSSALKFMIKNNSGPSVTNCIAKLDELEWDKEDIL